jgi:hypothetical protein
MKKWVILAVGLMIAVVAVDTFVLTRPLGSHPSTPTKSPRSYGMNISSTAFNNGGAIPARYSCQGAGVNPPLTIAQVPDEVQSLALVVDDPDAPGGTFDHWVMWNLPVSLTEIPENWEPASGVSVGANGVGKDAWTAPCPPSGTHHYHFKLYALDQKLGLAAGSDKAKLEQAMAGHTVARAELTGTFSK